MVIKKVINVIKDDFPDIPKLIYKRLKNPETVSN